MKLAYHCATHLKSDFETDVAATAKAGFSGLEVRGDKMDVFLKGHSLAKLDKLLKDNNVQPTAINSIEFIGFRGDEFEQIRQRCRHLCEIAGAIGCSTLVVVPSPTPQASAEQVLDLFFPWEKVVAEYVTVLQNLSDIAQPYNVTLAFEFLGFSWCSVRTPRGTAEIIEKTGRENVGLNFDACHFCAGGGDLSEINELDPAKICTFHINDMEDIPKEAMTDGKRLLPGLGIVPLDEICSRLKGIGYNGLCSIELFRSEYWDWDPFELAVKAREMTLKALSPYFDVE